MSVTANRVVTNTLWLYIRMAISMFASLFATRVILQGLGASDFGVYNIVGGAIAMLGFLNSAMTQATQRFMSFAEGQGDFDKSNRIFCVSILLHILLGFIVAILLFVCGIFFFRVLFNIPEDRIDAAKIVYISFIVSTVFNVMSVPYNAVINAHENMRYFAIIGIIESILHLLAAFCSLYVSFDKLVAYGIFMAMVPVMMVCVLRVYCKSNYKECNFSYNKACDIKLIKEIGSFAGWSFVSSSSSLIGNYGLRIVMNNYYGVLLNAAQGITGQVSALVMVLSSNMQKAINPVIAKTVGAGNSLQMLNMAMTTSKFSFFMLAIIGIPITIEVDTILILWLKDVPEWTTIFVRLQIIRLLIEQLSIVFDTSILADGRISSYSKIMGITNIVPLFLTILIFSLGIGPYAMYLLTITFFGLVVFGIRVYFMHKNCGMDYKGYFKNVLIPTVFATVIVFVISYLPMILMDQSIIRLIIVVCISLLCGIISFYYVGLNRSERSIVLSVIRSKIKNRYILL